ncbi:MAG: hypothetical protein ILA04_00615 [Prevotella sp.]|nr:hypothetical protein [Prevotella sp.]
MTIGGITIWLISRAQDIAPTHFSPSGKPDAYSSHTLILTPSAIQTITVLLIAFSAYLPQHQPAFPQRFGQHTTEKAWNTLEQDCCIVHTWLVLLIAVDTLTMKNHESNTPVLIMVGWHDRCLTCIHRHDI